jgi:dTMP kinase
MTFIVFEGGEGSGKSTQAERLAGWYRTQGREVVLTFEPGDTKIGAQIRDVLLHGNETVDPHAELLLMLADRAQHVADVIRPALDRGAIVISDRYSPSTLAYQGVGRGLGVETVAALDAFATGGLSPDVVVVLDVADAHDTRDRDRFERAGGAFHARVRAAYRDLAERYGWVVVDGSGSIADVETRVRAVVSARVR